MNKTMKLIIVLSLVLSCQTKVIEESNESGWILVYKHDKQGNALYGSKEKLIEAIQNGLAVRVGYGTKISEDRSLEHIADAGFLSILKIESQHEIFAQVDPIYRQNPFRENDTIAIKMVPDNQWRTTISTNGISSNAMINIFNDSLQGSNENRRGANWFVDYPVNYEAINKSLAFE